MRRARLTLAGLLVLVSCSEPQAPPNAVAYIPTRDSRICAITEIVDGDTVRIWCRQSGEVSARLVGFDTPETYRPSCAAEKQLGERATRHLDSVLRRADTIAPVSEGIDKYQRALVRLEIDGRNLADIMVEAGLARPYDGAKRPDWCDILN